MQIKKIIFILSICAVFISCSHEPAEEVDWSENNDRVFLENDCTDYFFHLTENYPSNSKGSCGYVAACALFAYYDLFFDENIVEEKYELRDVESFGLKHIELSDVENLDNYEYYDFLKTNQDKYLVAKLIVSANERFLDSSGDTILYRFKNKNPMMLFYGSQSRFSTCSSETQFIMNYYLHELRGFSKDYITVNKITTKRDVIIEKIKMGIPVVISVLKSSKGSGHTCIVYDYDEVEDEIYGHLLMMPEFNDSRIYNHIKITTFYKYIREPLVLEINTDYK